MIVETGERVLRRVRGVMERRVVTDEDDLDSLETEDAIGLRPPPVVADRHSHDAAESAPGSKPLGARLEVTPLEVLEPPPGLVLRVSGNVDLAVFPHDRAVALDEDLGVVVMPVRRELGVAERKADAQPLRLVEERPRRGIRHLRLEEGVDFGLRLEKPAGEEGGERELGIDHELGALLGGAMEEGEESFHDLDP